MRYYKREDVYGNTSTVESYSHDKDVAGATEINEVEFNDFVSNLPEAPCEVSFKDRVESIERRIQALETLTSP